MSIISLGLVIKAHSYMLCSERSIWRVLLPSYVDVPGVFHGNMHQFKVKHSEFDKVGMEAFSQVSLMDPRCATTFIADPKAIKEITRPKSPFIHETRVGRTLFGRFGPHILAFEGDEWKRHRRITQKGFSEENTKLVWSESVHALESLFEKWDVQVGPLVCIPQAAEITEQLALMVISSAVLGQRMSWDSGSNDSLPPGYSMSFQQSLSTATKTLVTRFLVPAWAESWSRSTRAMAIAFEEFGKYMKDMAAAYEHQGRLNPTLTGTEALLLAPNNDLFSIMMKTNEHGTDKSKEFTHEEVIGNSFIFLLAGHETTAHALAFSLGLLAAYPQVQEEVYAQVKTTLGLRKRLEYSDIHDLKLVRGTLFESLRLYPVAPRVGKLAVEDSILSVARSGADHERENIVIPAGSRVVLAFTAIHYNPRHWPEPEEFRPARFVGAYNRDAFLPFGIGRRACLGKRFAETEGVAVLATILARYEISIDQSKFAAIPGESLKARRERLLRPSFKISLKPNDLPLIFRRRG